MIQSIYTSVSNADIVPSCNKGLKISSDPIPLLRNNYLGEYRTELEKAKVRKNLGIADNTVIEWGNITGYIEDNPDLREALSYKLPEHLEDIIKEEFSSVKGALSWAIEYLSTFVMDTESIAWLKEETANIKLSILEKEKLIYIQIDSLSNDILNNIDNISNILNSIQLINDNIAKLNESLLSINVDANILNWIKNASSNSIELINDSKLEVKISEIENNAILVNEQGLFVLDLSKDVSTTKENIENLLNDVQTLLDNYVSKEDLGGTNFNFVNQEEYDQHILLINSKFSEIDTELDKTVKTGEDGHVDTLYVNTISKNNDDGNIKITDSFDVQSGIPLDVRFVRENLEELYKLPVAVCYPGMGVIVNVLSSLYILRRPAEGVTFNQEYIADPNNWKCPEDLVTVAMTRQAYEALKDEEINPNVFYYIYEDEITRTQAPKREEYETDAQFLEEWLKWEDSLKTLSQEYMSASWGVDIENKLALKASVQNVLTLSKEIEELKGGGSGISLESLNTEIIALKNEDLVIDKRLDEIINAVDGIESGRLVNVETLVATVNENLKTYVTKDELAELSDDFNFVKPEDYEADKELFKLTLAKNLTTQQITLNENVISVQEGVLQVNSESMAKASEVPNIKVLPQDEYDNLKNIDENTYYYTYNEDTIYVTQAELTKKLKSMQDQMGVLSQTISTLEKTIEDLKALHPQDEENV